MNTTMKRQWMVSLAVILGAIGSSAGVSALAGSLEPPPGPVSPTRPPDTCFDNTGNKFVDCGDGTIKDTATGLFWLKNADCLGLRTWADANIAAAGLAHGQCGLTDALFAGRLAAADAGVPIGVVLLIDGGHGRVRHDLRIRMHHSPLRVGQGGHGMLDRG